MPSRVSYFGSTFFTGHKDPFLRTYSTAATVPPRAQPVAQRKVIIHMDMAEGRTKLEAYLQAGNLPEAKNIARELAATNKGNSFEEMTTRLLAYYLLPTEVGRGIVQIAENLLLDACLLPEYQSDLLKILHTFKGYLQGKASTERVERFIEEVSDLSTD